MTIQITFPDGSTKEYPQGITAHGVAKAIGPKLAKDAIACKINDHLTDLTTPITQDATLKILTFEDPNGKEVFRHSAAHVVAYAIKKLYPEALPTIGPSVEEGFYYDFDNLEITPDDFEKIEAEIKAIIKEDLPFERITLTYEEAKEKFAHNLYKIEMIEELKELGQEMTAYTLGEHFVDLCTGPHVPSSSSLGVIKLTKIAGAYWRADATKKQLKRVYGVSFPTKKLLEKHLELQRQAELRDHRKLGKQLELFSIHEEAPGMPFFHDNGTYIWEKLKEFMTEEMVALGYELNKTPIILKKDLWLQSGHWDHYKENMYFTKIDDADYAVKPMNCPGNMLVFKTKVHSYRDLPVKAGEFGLVHRHELSGVLSGLFRVRVFTQDDAHVFCTQEQMKEQILELLDLVKRVYETFGFEYAVELSTRPEKAMGDEKTWEFAESTLADAMTERGITYQLNPGDGAFYGPKIDFHVKDCLGRSWQCGTIQLDFQMPEKFDLTYEGSDGTKHRPVMLHRAIYGSVERFLGILIEHYAGKFPLWLSPRQIRLITVADRFIDHAESVATHLKNNGLRVAVDTRAESVSKKVREAQLDQVNYIVVIGEKEQESNTLTVRTRQGEILGSQTIAEFLDNLHQEIEDKA